jgi:hypothetical protein
LFNPSEIHVSFLIEIGFLHGRTLLKGANDIFSLLKF